MANNKMARYNDEKKVTLWEDDFADGLYQGTYAGTIGIYQSPDGKYFCAHYHTNGLTYTGSSNLRLLPADVALAAVSTKYIDPVDNEAKIDPVRYLTDNGYVL